MKTLFSFLILTSQLIFAEDTRANYLVCGIFSKNSGSIIRESVLALKIDSGKNSSSKNDFMELTASLPDYGSIIVSVNANAQQNRQDFIFSKELFFHIRPYSPDLPAENYDSFGLRTYDSNNDFVCYRTVGDFPLNPFFN